MIGARIRQARLLADMTQRQLAERLRERDYTVTPAAISKYENNKSYPPAQFLLLACSELGVLSTYFSHQPAKTVEWKSFRRHSTLGKKQQEVAKQHAADLAELHIELWSLLYPDKFPKLPSPISVDTYAGAEQVANNLREMWDLGNRPLDNLVQTSEDRGVVVISWDDETGKFDGLSGWCGDYPVTVINTNRTADRIRFNLAHEIGHLAMDTANAEEDEESLVHRFAAALLVPANHAFHELGRRRYKLDWGELKMLKRKYGLSMTAWVRRAYDLGIINHSAYKTMNVELRKRGWHKEEPVQYQGDEEPIQLKQMAQRSIAEGLVSPDRFSRIGLEFWEPERDQSESTHLTVYDLMAMPEHERNAVMNRAFELAANEDFETFEAYEIYDEYDEDFDAKTSENL